MKTSVRGITLALILLSAFAVAQSSSDEITLYNAKGKPVAYIADDDDSTIYLWNGKPVAYLHSDDIYGFNGNHLGWFVKGVIHNHDGDVVGATKSHLMVIPEISPIKSLKDLKPLKGLRELKPLKPIFSLSWSEDETLRSFLSAGAD